MEQSAVFSHWAISHGSYSKLCATLCAVVELQSRQASHQAEGLTETMPRERICCKYHCKQRDGVNGKQRLE